MYMDTDISVINNYDTAHFGESGSEPSDKIFKE